MATNVPSVSVTVTTFSADAQSVLGEESLRTTAHGYHEWIRRSQRLSTGWQAVAASDLACSPITNFITDLIELCVCVCALPPSSYIPSVRTDAL